MIPLQVATAALTHFDTDRQHRRCLTDFTNCEKKWLNKPNSTAATATDIVAVATATAATAAAAAAAA